MIIFSKDYLNYLVTKNVLVKLVKTIKDIANETNLSKNLPKALAYLESLKSTNNYKDPNVVEATYVLGVLYAGGHGVTKDTKKAAELFIFLASNVAHPPAQNFLGILYFKGEGVQRDIEQGIQMFAFASKQGYVPGHLNLTAIGKSYHDGSSFQGVEILKDTEKSVRLFTLAAEQGDAEAEFYLGLLLSDRYEHGAFGYSQDLFTALKHYKQASEATKYSVVTIKSIDKKYVAEKISHYEPLIKFSTKLFDICASMERVSLKQCNRGIVNIIAEYAYESPKEKSALKK